MGTTKLAAGALLAAGLCGAACWIWQGQRAAGADEAELARQRALRNAQLQQRLNPRLAQIQFRQPGFRGRRPLDEMDESAAPADGVFLPPDRRIMQRLDGARQSLERREFFDAVKALDAILQGAGMNADDRSGQDDFFFKPDPQQSVYRSLKAEARRLLLDMPADGRAEYERQFGAESQRVLSSAVAGGDVLALGEVARRFFLTKAGAEATVLLGRHHLDHGRPLAAALCFQRVLDTPQAADAFDPVLSVLAASGYARSGLTEKAREVLVSLKRRRPDCELKLGGKQIKLFADEAQALAWLGEQVGPLRLSRALAAGQWAMFRGSPARNAESAGALPLLYRRWQQKVSPYDLTSGRDSVGSALAGMRQNFQLQDVPALPALHPLAVGDYVVMRTPSELWGIDAASGKLVWKYPIDLGQPAQPVAASARSGNPALTLAQSIGQRVWDDETYGTLSSDGEAVYFVDDLESASTTGPPSIVRFNGRRSMMVAKAMSTNRLVSLDLARQGSLRWEIGGGDGRQEPKLADAFFLGPPLPLQGKLYALVEMKGEIRLVSLAAGSGELEWSQQLAFVEQDPVQFSARRFSGVSPSFADGVIVCPTEAGAVVAIDLTTRSLLWGYQYAVNPARIYERRMLMQQRAMMGAAPYVPTTPQKGTRWVDATLTLSGGRVLITPNDANEMYCLDLLTGKELWKRDRGTELYVGCVRQDQVMLVGHHHVTALKLSDGTQTWRQELPDGAMPSGRGFYSGDHYFLPLSTAEVARIDLGSGRIDQRARSQNGVVPGNLICYRGQVISQNIDVIEAYDQLDVLRQSVAETLKKTPDDPKALRQLGEIKLNDGQLDEAIQLVRRSLSLRDRPDTRRLLCDSLLAGLRGDFSTYRGSIEEVERLLDEPSERVALKRLVATGRIKLGDATGGMAAVLELADLPGAPDDLDTLDASLAVRRERMVRPLIAGILAIAKPEQRAEIDRQISKRLEMARQDGSPTALAEFIGTFAPHPLADEVREQLAVKLAEAGRRAEAEPLLIELLGSQDDARVRSATARLARLLETSRRPDHAAMLYRQLRDRWGDAPCLDGRSGKELVAALAADSPVGALISAPKPWPAGKVKLNEDIVSAPRSLPGPFPRLSVELRGAVGPFFADTSVVHDSGMFSFIGRDGLGVERFRTTGSELRAQRQSRNNFQANVWMAAQGIEMAIGGLPPSAAAHGHALLSAVGGTVTAYDTAFGGESPSVLWSQDVLDAQAMSSLQYRQSKTLAVPWGAALAVATDANGRDIAPLLGPATAAGVCVQRFRELLCLDPLTGQTLWSRQNVAQGSAIYGDGELLLVAGPGESKALVLRTLDGEVLGEREFPAAENRVASLGRQVLVWRVDGDRSVLALADPWEGKDKWSQSFAVGAKAAVLADEAVGVLQPDGKFGMWRIADGKPQLSQKLPAAEKLAAIYLIGSSTQVFLIAADTSTPADRTPGATISGNQVVNGSVYAFDRATGEPAWKSPVPLNQQGIWLSQPRELPVLAFASQTTLNQPGGTQARANVLLLDRRTGRVLYKGDSLPFANLAALELVGDPAKSLVRLTLPGRSIVLQFTDEAWDAQATIDRDKKVNVDAARAADAIIKAFGRASRRLGGGGQPADDDADPKNPFGDP